MGEVPGLELLRVGSGEVVPGLGMCGVQRLLRAEGSAGVEVMVVVDVCATCWRG